MSALPPKADIDGARRNVRFGPITEVAASFDCLIGGCEKLRLVRPSATFSFEFLEFPGIARFQELRQER
jgi:hypothetical protein